MVELTFDDIRCSLWRQDGSGEARLLGKLIGDVSRDGFISRIRAMSADGGPVVFHPGDPAISWALEVLESLKGLPMPMRMVSERKEDIHVELP